jgi:hypothetical protein
LLGAHIEAQVCYNSVRAEVRTNDVAGSGQAFVVDLGLPDVGNNPVPRALAMSRRTVPGFVSDKKIKSHERLVSKGKDRRALAY